MWRCYHTSRVYLSCLSVPLYIRIQLLRRGGSVYPFELCCWFEVSRRVQCTSSDIHFNLKMVYYRPFGDAPVEEMLWNAFCNFIFSSCSSCYWRIYCSSSIARISRSGCWNNKGSKAARGMEVEFQKVA